MSYETRVREEMAAADVRRKKRQQRDYEQYRTKSAERERLREAEEECKRQLGEYMDAPLERYKPPLIPCAPKTLFARPSGLSDKQWKRMREKANRRSRAASAANS